MKITVKYIPTHWVVGVEDNDFWHCQHPSTEHGTVNALYTGANGDIDDYDMLIEACEDCGAYYYPYDNDGWRNERPVAIKRFGGEL